MPERPVNNLPPGSQPWAREIAGAIDAAQFDATRANMNNKNAFKTINATLDRLAEQVVALQETQNMLVAQQAQLTELALNQVTGGSYSGSSINQSAGTTGLKAVATISVPAGYTRAAVITIISFTTVSGSGRVQCDAQIDGQTSASVTIPAVSGSGNGTSVAHARYMTGLSGSFQTGGYISFSNIGYSVFNSTLVTFLK